MTPATEKAAGVSAEQRLKNLATKIEQTYDSWVSPLLNYLDDPVTQENLDLLQAAERKLIDTFRSEKALPDPLSNKLVTALAQTMKGLARVPISATKLCDALFPAGAPATVDDVKERFTAHLDQLVKGLDRGKVRMVLETEETP
jgi:hypothetical protein